MTFLKKAPLLLLSAICFLLACKSTKTATTLPQTPDTPVAADSSSVIPTLPKPTTVKTDLLLEKMLASKPEYFKELLKNRAVWKVQILYTQIDRNAENKPSFTDYAFNIDPAQYFYPASTVKLPVALLALQKLNQLKLSSVNRSSIMITEAEYSGETPVYNDPSSTDGSPSIEQYIKKIFLTSDNDAYNRLYEWVSPQYINEQLEQKGYGSAQINHRLEVFLSDDENRHTNPIIFIDTAANVLYRQAAQHNKRPHAKREDYIGDGYYKSDVLINEPLNFSIKNRLSLPDLHALLKATIFPQAVDARQRFNLQGDDYRFVWKYMSQQPQESSNPDYNNIYPNNYCKFLMAGGKPDSPLPQSLRIFNKSGDAYGFLIDAAYIVDFEKKIEFILSAVIYCNSDGILNDDQYDYETIGLPFMQHLGQVIYDYELKRKKHHEPDLSEFMIQYDK